MKNPYILCLLALVGYVLAIFISSIAIGIIYFDDNSIYRQSADVVDGLSYLILLAALFYFSKDRLDLSISAKGVLLSIILGMALRLFVISLNYLIGLSNYPELGYRFLFSINIIFLIPIVEELFFRDFILTVLQRNKVTVFRAVLFSSILFSFVHIDSGILAMTYSLFTGLILGVFYFKFGLTAVIIAHIVDNLLWYLSRLIFPSFDFF